MHGERMRVSTASAGEHWPSGDGGGQAVATPKVRVEAIGDGVSGLLALFRPRLRLPSAVGGPSGLSPPGESA